MELHRITRQIHCKAVEQRATFIHRQYNRDWGTSYSRPPIDPYLTSPLLQNPGGATDSDIIHTSTTHSPVLLRYPRASQLLQGLHSPHLVRTNRLFASSRYSARGCGPSFGSSNTYRTGKMSLAPTTGTVAAVVTHASNIFVNTNMAYT